jgi:hypothetical protein
MAKILSIPQRARRSYLFEKIKDRSKRNQKSANPNPSFQTTPKNPSSNFEPWPNQLRLKNMASSSQLE